MDNDACMKPMGKHSDANVDNVYWANRPLIAPEEQLCRRGDLCIMHISALSNLPG